MSGASHQPLAPDAEEPYLPGMWACRMGVALAYPRGLRVIAGTTVILGDVPCRPEGKERKKEAGAMLFRCMAYLVSASAAEPRLFLFQKLATPFVCASPSISAC